MEGREESDLEQALANSLKTYQNEQERREETSKVLQHGNMKQLRNLRVDLDSKEVRPDLKPLVNEDFGVVTTAVKPRSRPERKTYEAHRKERYSQPILHSGQSASIPPPPRRGSTNQMKMTTEQDLISFITPSGNDKSSPHDFLGELAALDLSYKDSSVNKYKRNSTGSNASASESGHLQMKRVSLGGFPPSNMQKTVDGVIHRFSSQSPSPMEQFSYQNRPTSLQTPQNLQTIVRRNETTNTVMQNWIPLNESIRAMNSAMVKSQSWSDGKPVTSTPKDLVTNFLPYSKFPSPRFASGIFSPSQHFDSPVVISPGFRSPSSSVGSELGRPVRRYMKVDNESLIDLDVPESNKTTVSVLEEFDPLAEQSQDEEIYWSSRESTSNFSESFYDSYDPFSYMSDRAEILGQQAGLDDTDAETPNLPPRIKKVGIVRPQPHVSEAKLNRRKTVARSYENVVKKDANFFKFKGLNKTAAVAQDSEVLAFTAMVREIRMKYKYTTLTTNPGFVEGVRLKSKYPDETELKLKVFPRLSKSTGTDSAVVFTANVHSDLTQIIAKALIELDQNVDDCGLYYLQVYGKGEYLHSGFLDEFEYIHHCYKFDRDVELTLVHHDLLRRDFLRIESDDEQDTCIEYSQISPLDRANTLSHEDLKTLLEFLQKEAERINNTISTLVSCSEKNVIQLINPKGFLQSVKAVCAKLGGIETTDLAEALDDFSQACVRFDKAKGNEDPAGRLRPEIVEAVGERYAMVTLNRAAKESLDKSGDDIKSSIRVVTEKVYSLIRTYARTFRVDFSLDEIDTLTPGELKQNISVQESLLVRVGCLHRLDMNWEFQDYKVDVRLYHGTRLIRETHSTDFQVVEHSHQRLHKTVTFNTWIDFKNLQISSIPLECRLVLCLVGRGKDLESKDSMQLIELGWTSLQLYSLERNLSQGPYLLALWPMEVTQQIGPAPDSSSHPKADSCPLLSLELLDLGGPVQFVDIEPVPPTATDQTLDQLDFKTRDLLLSMCEQDIRSFHNRPAQDREILWEKRAYLRKTFGALPKVLLSVQSWDPETLKDLYGLLQSWPKPEIADILQLLLPIFPDVEVRKKAIEWLAEESTEVILDILPQLIEAVKHETWTVSSLVSFLLERCLSSPMLSHSLYWQLTQCLPGISPQNSDGESDDEAVGIKLARHKRRLQLLLRTLFVISGAAMRNGFLAQQVLIKELYQSAEAVKASKDSNRQTILARHMENLHHQLRITPTILPLSASLKANGVDVKNCQYFNSNTFPMKIVFNSSEDDGGNIQMIYKVGDDLRQDMLTLQLIRVMDRLWLKHSLDLRIVYFSCVPTGAKSGMVEYVDDAKTLREIQVADTGVTGAFRSETLNDWLQKYNPSQLEYKRAVSNFTRSSAGYSVITYILGICDRHNDNIMLKTSGHLFHIDFGKFLGDAQKFGAIKRDRVPFVLTPDMLYVINGGKGSTEKFHIFVELCCKAFNILRQEGDLILTLFALMASSGIPGVTKEAVTYVHDRLLLDLSEEEAAARFGQLIHESINSSLSTQLNFFVHNLAQMKFGKGASTDDNTTLSFIPNKYSMKSDGKIKEVVVHGLQKRYDTEKYYVFILRVSRQGIKDPSYIFRTYKQFCEFHARLCYEYPLEKFHSITCGYSIGRSNVREVAEKRKREIATFLATLFLLAEEISHSDLVYTFFHPLLKDEEETSIHIQKLKDPRGHERRPSTGKIHGRLKLKVYYRNQTLHVLIQFAENLSLNDGREEPNSYVKVYLHPDPHKQTKRKTKVVKRSCNPTFMEMLEYRTPLDKVRYRKLQATIWDSSQFQENMFLGSVTVGLDSIDLEQGIEQWFPLGQFYR